jgi:transposase
MPQKALINKDHATVKELQDHIKILEQDVKVLNKLNFILDLYHEDTIKNAINKRGISQVTGSKWLKQWNEKGIRGLYRKKGSGAKSRLSNEQKKELEILILEKNLNSTRQIRKLIIDEFNVEYSVRQVERILKELKFGYAKPYPIYSKMSKNAPELLKKNFDY